MHRIAAPEPERPKGRIVQAQSLFQLLNPLIFVLFSAAFFGVHAANPKARGLIRLSLSYAVGAAAFIFDFFRGPMPDWLAAFGSNGLYLATSILFVAGVTCRYGVRTPWGAIAAAGLLFGAAYAWHFLVVDDIWMRTYATSLGNGAVIAIGLAAIAGQALRGPDRIVLAVYAVLTAQFFIRPFVVAHFSADMTMETYTQSLFFLTLHLVVGALAIAMAMTLLSVYSMEIFRELASRSVTDSLSGVLNRRGFEDAAAAALDRGEAASAIICDIDRFKSVNDTYGHAFGDAVIAEMGALLRAYAHGGRIAGRLGGEEFALLVPARLDDARDIAEAMRRTFASIVFEAKGARPTFTASLGVAMRQPEENLAALLSRADEALYLAKESGRDRVACESDVAVARLQGALDRLERRQFRRPVRAKAL